MNLKVFILEYSHFKKTNKKNQIQVINHFQSEFIFNVYFVETDGYKCPFCFSSFFFFFLRSFSFHLFAAHLPFTCSFISRRFANYNISTASTQKCEWFLLKSSKMPCQINCWMVFVFRFVFGVMKMERISFFRPRISFRLNCAYINKNPFAFRSYVCG